MQGRTWAKKIWETSSLFQSSSCCSAHCQRPRYHGLNLADLEDILMDPAWKKAVFYRDPVTRFLSGYRSKCEKGRDGAKYCGPDCSHPACEAGFGSPLATFDQAIATVQANEIGNPHWDPQYHACGGLDTTLEHYDFVTELRPEDAEDRILELLQLIGLDTDNLDPAISELIVRPEEDPHVTKAEEKCCEYYNTREKWEAVVKYYKEDYKLFHMKPIPPPCSWDAHDGHRHPDPENN
ncbi:unnamed protein product [Chrysoparadoxa australica]